MKILKICFALLFVSSVIVFSTIWWKKENNHEKENLSTGKMMKIEKSKEEVLMKPVEKENLQEDKKEKEKKENKIEEEIITKDENPSSNNDNVLLEKNPNLSSNNDYNHQTIITNSIDNERNQQAEQSQEKPKEEKTENTEQSFDNSISSEVQTYTKENDIPADPGLIKDKSTYQECQEYGNKIIKAHPTECQYGCAISCRSIMGKYTKEEIGFMLTIRLMDGTGTKLPFRNN